MGRGKPRADAPPSEVERLEQATAQAREVLIQITHATKGLRAAEKALIEFVDTQITNYLKSRMDQELDNLAQGIERNIRSASNNAISVFRSNLVALIKLIQMTKRDMRDELVKRTMGAETAVPRELAMRVVETLIESVDSEQAMILAKIDGLDITINRKDAG